MNLYVRNKLSTKLNLIMSQGTKSDGVVTDKVIDSMMKSFDGYGVYEIVWDKARLFPIGLSKLSDKYTVSRSGKNYVMTFEGQYEKVLFWSQIINFDIQEWREQQLKKVLKNT
jgi:hypothetical protein